jgi:hypothetical protein
VLHCNGSNRTGHKDGNLRWDSCKQDIFRRVRGREHCLRDWGRQEAPRIYKYRGLCFLVYRWRDARHDMMFDHHHAEMLHSSLSTLAICHAIAPVYRVSGNRGKPNVDITKATEAILMPIAEEMIRPYPSEGGYVARRMKLARSTQHWGGQESCPAPSRPPGRETIATGTSSSPVFTSQIASYSTSPISFTWSPLRTATQSCCSVTPH